VLRLNLLQYNKYIHPNPITFMKYFLILTIFLVVMISLCTALPFDIPGLPFFGLSNETNQTQIGLLKINTDSPDMFIRVEAIPSEVKSGRSETINFEIENKNSYDLKNVKVEAYDPCVFIGEFSKSIGVIKGNRTYMWSWTWKTEKTDVDKNCNVKFRIEYEADNTYYQDIAVLSESEYQLREIQGTLNQVPVQFSYPNSPFKISLKISDEQPLLNNENYYMYIDYVNIGGGLLDVKSVRINAPDNIKDISCKDYSGDAILTLNRIPLDFVGNRASTSTCSFTSTTSEPLKISSLVLITSYKYSIYDVISINVKRA